MTCLTLFLMGLFIWLLIGFGAVVFMYYRLDEEIRYGDIHACLAMIAMGPIAMIMALKDYFESRRNDIFLDKPSSLKEKDKQ